MADKQTIKDLLTDEIKDLYSAEKQLTKAIPKMAKGLDHARTLQASPSAGTSPKPEKQVQRLEEAAELLGIKATGKKCVGMEGVVQEERRRRLAGRRRRRRPRSWNYRAPGAGWSTTK